MTLSPTEFARKLGLLTGDDFEEAVVIAFQHTFSGFQKVPRKPNGDGGLDGISHDFTKGYCCYGPQWQVIGPTTTPGALRVKISDKFKEDLLRLLELEIKDAVLVQVTNVQLVGILTDSPSAKIKCITLISNWFEDNRIVGDLKEFFKKSLAVSRKRFVDAACDLVVWGPADVANNTTITQQMLLLVEHPGFLLALQTADAQAKSYEPPSQDMFGSKFDALATMYPDEVTTINELRATFKQGWSRSILLNQTLSSALPELHRQFEKIRQLAATNARLTSMQAGVDPFKLIETNTAYLTQRMDQLVAGGLPAQIRDELAEAETGRLIGDCPLTFRTPKK